EIKGTKRTRIIGKELEIRRTLSETHLYSSAFSVRSCGADESGVPCRWIISGNGWGHGVGLCQIGAAVMAHEGYGYRDILRFYFPGARLVTIY
ncbi:MAG: amidase, partial [Paramuribaculum sp.]|nr:amidase [Paramuribaculum sp.]